MELPLVPVRFTSTLKFMHVRAETEVLECGDQPVNLIHPSIGSSSFLNICIVVLERLLPPLRDVAKETVQGTRK